MTCTRRYVIATAAMLPLLMPCEAPAKSGHHGGSNSHEREQGQQSKALSGKKRDGLEQPQHGPRRIPGVIENALSVETNIPDYDDDNYGRRRPRYD